MIQKSIELKKRIKELDELIGKKDLLLFHTHTLQEEMTEVETLIRKVRIGKKSKNKYDIICECKRVYPTDKNPDDYHKDRRPQCSCGKRVKRKEPVKREDLARKWSKKN